MPYLRAGARIAGRVAGRYVRSRYQQWRTKKQSIRSGQGVTDHYDKRTIYRKKRMSRKMRKRWRKKKNQFDAMLLKRLGTKTIVFNDELTTGNWNGGTQRNLVVHLYGKNGTERGTGGAIENGNRDVYDIMINDPMSNEEIEKICFESAVLDFTAANSGDTTLEVDVYEMYTGGLRKESPNWGTDQGQAQAVPAPGGGPATMNLDSRGVTPFEFPTMSTLGYKIIKKTKYLLGPGKSFTYQVRDPKNRWVKGTDVYESVNGNDFTLRGATRTFLFLAKPQVGQALDLDSKLSIGSTRVYRYKVLENNRIESENLF